MAMITKPLFSCSSGGFRGFHDPSPLFMNPLFPGLQDDVTLFVRVPAGTMELGALLFTPARPVAQTGGTDLYTEIPLTFSHTDKTGGQEFWSARLPAQEKAVRYRFRLRAKGRDWYVLPHGTFRHAPRCARRDFLLQPGFQTPAWSHGVTYYSIMPDSFYNGDPDNDTRNDYSSLAAPFGMDHRGLNDWFGGDLLGIEKKFAYIHDYIGADAIALNPLWQSYSVAGYGANNLKMINAHFTSEAGLSAFLQAAHQKGFHVLLDAVFAYYVANSPLFNSTGYWPLPGAGTDKSSKYADFFAFTNWPQTLLSWGQPVIDLDGASAKEYVYTTPDSVVQTYLKAPYHADGWRFDVGNTLYGHERNEHEILKDIRGYLKKANPDALFLSEHGSTADMFDETLDSKWNYDFYRPLVEWAQGAITQSELAASLFEAVNRLPRPVALSVYNFLSNHDTPSIAYLLHYDYRAVKSAQILLMTYLGSPCIYYGDETGSRVVPNLDENGASRYGTHFDCMQWNRDLWNPEITALYRSLCELRRTHTSLRTGTFETLAADDEAKVFAFARYDADSIVLALTTRSEADQTFPLEVAALGMAEGDRFTNWLTGETVAVEGGKIAVFLRAEDGGAVLVSDGGRRSGRFRRQYELLGDGGEEPADCAQYEGEQLRLRAQTPVRLLGMEAENTGALTWTLDRLEEGAAGAAVLCDQLDGTGAVYAAVCRGGRLALYAANGGETPQLLHESSCALPLSLRLERRAGNAFAALLETPAGWQALEGSQIRLDMDTHLLAGAAALQGELLGSPPLWEAGERCYGDRFDSLPLDSLFHLRQAPAHRLEGESLRLAPGKMLRAPAPFSDFSVRTQLDVRPVGEGDALWLTLCLDDTDFLLLGRQKQGGQNRLLFAREQNGSRQIWASIPDETDAAVTVQLQRIGTKAAAFYRGEGEEGWHALFQPIHYNISEPSAGLLAEQTDGLFGYFTFGEYVFESDGSFYTPVCEEPLSLSPADFFSAPEGHFVPYSGEWENALGGFCQRQSSGLAAMGLEDKPLRDLYAETTLRRLEGGGWAGFGWHMAKPCAGEGGGGLLVRLFADNRLELVQGDTVLAACTVPDNLFQGGALRLCVQAAGGVVTVKAGLRSRTLLQAAEDRMAQGVCAFFCMDCACAFENFKFTRDATTWTFLPGANWQAGRFTASGIMSWTTLNRYAFTDVEVSARVRVQGPVTACPHAEEAGFHFSPAAGFTPVYGGLRVGLNSRGGVFVRSGDAELAAATLPAPAEEVRLTIRLCSGTLLLSVDGQESLRWQAPLKNGYAFQLYAINADSSFEELSIRPLPHGGGAAH